MAGHRRKTGKAKTAARRRQLWRARISAATSSEQMFDVASDWYRATVSRVPDAGRRTELLNDAGAYLAGRADELARELIP
jgi:hypothetical protein